MKTSHGGAADRPTDLDLMLYADGELPEDRLAAVEAYLAEDRGAQQKMIALGIVSGVVRGEAIAGAAKGGDIADLVMRSIAEQPAPGGEVVPLRAAEKTGKQKRRAANDNGRGSLWALAAFAAAAAASLLVWNRDPAPSTHASADHSARPALSAPGEPAKIEAPRPEGDADPGVEVAAVDFGGLTGAVFYVPGTSASTTTTVVWLSDDSSGGNE